MKKIFFSLFLIVIISGSFLYFFQPISHCNTPVLYHLGSVDPRFNLTQNQAENYINEAVNLWNNQESKTLFKEDPQGKLSVNFVFDERQAISNKINSQENAINSSKASLESKMALFNSQKASLEMQINSLNSQIDSWNQKGGAPKEIFEQLTKEQQNLRSQIENLQQQANSLNQQTSNFNFQVNNLNSTINSFNQTLNEKPEEGLYNSKEQAIYIYLTNTKKELVHTLAHEFGHALAIPHTQNPESIMYPYTSQSISLAPEDITELKTTCQPVPRFQTAVENFKLFNVSL